MNRITLVITTFILIHNAMGGNPVLNNIKAPTADKVAYEIEIAGNKISDQYHWMRAQGWPNSVKDQKVLDYLTEENKYFDSFISPLEKEKNIIFEELKGRIKLSDQSTYIKRDKYYYYTRTEEDKEYPIYCRKYGSTDSKEEILLNVNELAKEQKFTSIGGFAISPDHNLMAYSVDHTGGEKFTIKLYDIKSAKYLSDIIEDTAGSVIWHEDQSGFFYTPIEPDNWRHNKVYFHKLGTNKKEDRLIYHEQDHLYYTSVGKASSKKYIFILVNGHDSNEIYYIDMQDKSLTPKVVLKRKDMVQYSVDHNGDYFYMSTNNGAKNFKLLRSESKNYSSSSKWIDYIKEDKNKYLSSFDITKDFLLINYRIKGLPELVVHNLNDTIEKKLTFPEAAYSARIYSTNFEENDIRSDYSSMARPNTTYSYDFNLGNLNTLKVQEIPSGHDPKQYTVERIFVKTDNVEVPITILYKNDLFKHDGSNPLYLYGYGSYGINIPPVFKNTAISLANRGFVYAIAHIRGGDDLGYDWYESAKFLNKKRTFADFIAAADELVNKKYTSKGNIAIMGGSAGGMLIGNVINQRPELFKAAVAHVPFVDVLNTMLDETLPLTPGEFKEWGNPKDKEYFDYIKSYSPYDNVAKQNYPNIMVTAGLSDPRVGYWEASKWVAKLRDQKTDNNIIIFKTNMSFGHQGASGRFDYLKEAAEDLVFIFKMFGLEIK